MALRQRNGLDRLMNLGDEIGGLSDEEKARLTAFQSALHGADPEPARPVQGTVDPDNPDENDLSSIITGASKKYKIPESLIYAVIEQESRFNPKATSPKDARGLMQLMEGTAADMGVTDRYDMKQNVYGGTKYLAQMLDKAGGRLDIALQLYNAGPTKTEKVYSGAIDSVSGKPHQFRKETVDYVKKVWDHYQKYEGRKDLPNVPLPPAMQVGETEVPSNDAIPTRDDVVNKPEKVKGFWQNLFEMYAKQPVAGGAGVFMVPTDQTQEVARGTGEALLHLKSLGIAIPVAGLGAMGEFLPKPVPSDDPMARPGALKPDPRSWEERGDDAVAHIHSVMDKLTYMPKTKEGKEVSAMVMYPFEKLQEVGDNYALIVYDEAIRQGASHQTAAKLAAAESTVIESLPILLPMLVKGGPKAVRSANKSFTDFTTKIKNSERYRNATIKERGLITQDIAKQYTENIAKMSEAQLLRKLRKDSAAWEAAQQKQGIQGEAGKRAAAKRANEAAKEDGGHGKLTDEEHKAYMAEREEYVKNLQEQHKLEGIESVDTGRVAPRRTTQETLQDKARRATMEGEAPPVSREAKLSKLKGVVKEVKKTAPEVDTKAAEKKIAKVYDDPQKEIVSYKFFKGFPGKTTIETVGTVAQAYQSYIDTYGEGALDANQKVVTKVGSNKPGAIIKYYREKFGIKTPIQFRWAGGSQRTATRQAFNWGNARLDPQGGGKGNPLYTITLDPILKPKTGKLHDFFGAIVLRHELEHLRDFEVGYRGAMVGGWHHQHYIQFDTQYGFKTIFPDKQVIAETIMAMQGGKRKAPTRTDQPSIVPKKSPKKDKTLQQQLKEAAEKGDKRADLEGTAPAVRGKGKKTELEGVKPFKPLSKTRKLRMAAKARAEGKRRVKTELARRAAIATKKADQKLALDIARKEAKKLGNEDIAGEVMPHMLREMNSDKFKNLKTKKDKRNFLTNRARSRLIDVAKKEARRGVGSEKSEPIVTDKAFDFETGKEELKKGERPDVAERGTSEILAEVMDLREKAKTAKGKKLERIQAAIKSLNKEIEQLAPKAQEAKSKAAEESRKKTLIKRQGELVAKRAAEAKERAQRGIREAREEAQKQTQQRQLEKASVKNALDKLNKKQLEHIINIYDVKLGKHEKTKADLIARIMERGDIFDAIKRIKGQPVKNPGKAKGSDMVERSTKLRHYRRKTSAEIDLEDVREADPKGDYRLIVAGDGWDIVSVQKFKVGKVTKKQLESVGLVKGGKLRDDLFGEAFEAPTEADLKEQVRLLEQKRKDIEKKLAFFKPKDFSKAKAPPVPKPTGKEKLVKGRQLQKVEGQPRTITEGALDAAALRAIREKALLEQLDEPAKVTPTEIEQLKPIVRRIQSKPKKFWTPDQKKIVDRYKALKKALKGKPDNAGRTENDKAITKELDKPKNKLAKNAKATGDEFSGMNIKDLRQMARDEGITPKGRSKVEVINSIKEGRVKELPSETGNTIDPNLDKGATERQSLSREVYKRSSRAVKEAAVDAYKLIDVEAPWQHIDAHNVGKAIKSRHGTAEWYIREAEDVAKAYVKAIKKNFPGIKGEEFKVAMAEAVLAAERIDGVNKIKPVVGEEYAEGLRESVNILRKYFDEKDTLYKGRGINANFVENAKKDWLEKATKRGQSGNLGPLQTALNALEELQDLQYVHIPKMQWFPPLSKKARRAKRNAVYAKRGANMDALIKKHKRRALSISEMIKNDVIELTDVNPVEIILDYGHQVGRDMAMLDIRDAALADGHAFKAGGKVPAGMEDVKWEKLTGKKHSVFHGYKLSPELVDGIDIAMKSTMDLGRWGRAVAITKMMQFYNPLFMPFYDIEQSLIMAGGATRPDVWAKSMAKAITDIRTKSADYETAYLNNTFSQPYANPATNIQNMVREIEFISGKEGPAGVAIDAVKLFAARGGGALMGFKGRVPVINTFYNASWNTAWYLDNLIRMTTYNFLRDRGMNPAQAAYAAARVHADYASVPAKTRKVLNQIIFTPTFFLSMMKVQGQMTKSMVKELAYAGTGGKFKGAKTSKVERRLAIGFLSTAAFITALEMLMRSHGWETDELGRKWHRKIKVPGEPDREQVFTIPTPMTKMFKYIDWGYELVADNPEIKTPLDHLGKLGLDVTPLYRIAYSVLNNRQINGDPVYYEFDQPNVKRWKVGKYTAREVLGILDFFAEAEQRFATETPKSRAAMEKELGTVIKWLTNLKLAYVYGRGNEDSRLQYRLDEMEGALYKDLFKRYRQGKLTKEDQEMWFKEYSRRTGQLIKEYEEEKKRKKKR